MYRRSKFQEVLLEIRQEMAREADYDVDLFAEIARSGTRVNEKKKRSLLMSPTETEKHAGKRPVILKPDFPV